MGIKTKNSRRMTRGENYDKTPVLGRIIRNEKQTIKKKGKSGGPTSTRRWLKGV